MKSKARFHSFILFRVALRKLKKKKGEKVVFLGRGVGIFEISLF